MIPLSMRDRVLSAGGAEEGSCLTLVGKGGGGLKKYWLSGAVLLLLLLTLSGCFFREPEDLYQSPEQSADYLSLTQTIRNVKDSLAQEYGVEVEDVSVVSGDNTALIQLQDLDRDGERETAVTFFRVSEAEKPLKIYFFTRTAEDTYTVSAMVEGKRDRHLPGGLCGPQRKRLQGSGGQLADEHRVYLWGPTPWRRRWCAVFSTRPAAPQGAPPPRGSRTGRPCGPRSG